MTIRWYEKEEILRVVREDLTPARTVLDIGCGIRPQTYIVPLVHICCDPFEQYVQHLLEKVETDIQGTFVIIKASWRDLAEKLPAQSVDTVFLLDVIEHLEKEEGLRLLKMTERIAKQQIIIFTPLGFLPQEYEGGADAWGLGGADCQQHKSGWLPDEDFDESWDIYASREFHMVDSIGEQFEKPYGAFWAVKTLPSSNSPAKEDSVFTEVNRVLSAMGADPLEIEDFLSTVLVRTAKAVRKLETVEAGKEFYIDATNRLNKEMLALSEETTLLNKEMLALSEEMLALNNLNKEMQAVNRALEERIENQTWRCRLVNFLFRR
jgi:hypothetical protein